MEYPTECPRCKNEGDLHSEKTSFDGEVIRTFLCFKCHWSLDINEGMSLGRWACSRKSRLSGKHKTGKTPQGTGTDVPAPERVGQALAEASPAYMLSILSA